MTSTSLLAFRLGHRDTDSWGFNNQSRQVDRDLARDLMGLFERVDSTLEDILTFALAKHRKADRGTKGTCSCDEGDDS